LAAFTPKATPQIQFGAGVALVPGHERHSAVVLPSLGVADPVIAQRHLLRFALFVGVGVPVFIVQSTEVADRLRHDVIVSLPGIPAARRMSRRGLAADR
jgi:hypothetical protein